jgi:hypothetical protein
MVAKRSKKHSTVEQHEEKIGTYAEFRRAVHSKGKLLKGLGFARTKLIPSSIPQIVGQIAKLPIYLNVMVRNPFPEKINRLKQKKALPLASDRVEAAWTASVLSLFTTELCQFVELRDGYYESLARSDYVESARFLEEIQKELGFSLWLISDFGDDSKSDDYQAYAAAVSVDFLDKMLRRLCKNS